MVIHDASTEDEEQLDEDDVDDSQVDEEDADEADNALEEDALWDWPIRTGQDVRCVMASMKSYIGASVVTFVLYWLFWFPGLIVNVMYYREARRMERLAAQNLPGVGCLMVQLALAVVWLVLVIYIAFRFWGQLHQLIPVS